MGLFDILFNLGGLAKGITNMENNPNSKKKAKGEEPQLEEEPNMFYCPVCKKETEHKYSSTNRYRCTVCKNLTEI